MTKWCEINLLEWEFGRIGLFFLNELTLFGLVFSRSGLSSSSRLISDPWSCIQIRVLLIWMSIDALSLCPFVVVSGLSCVGNFGRFLLCEQSALSRAFISFAECIAIVFVSSLRLSTAYGLRLLWLFCFWPLSGLSAALSFNLLSPLLLMGFWSVGRWNEIMENLQVCYKRLEEFVSIEFVVLLF